MPKNLKNNSDKNNEKRNKIRIRNNKTASRALNFKTTESN